MTKEQLSEMRNVRNAEDLAMEEEEVVYVPVTYTAAPTVKGQEGTVDGALSNGKKHQREYGSAPPDDVGV